MSEETKEEQQDFAEGRYQLQIVSTDAESKDKPGVISQSGTLKSNAQLEAWFMKAKGTMVAPEGKQWVCIKEGSDGWVVDHGADQHRVANAELEKGPTSDPLVNVGDGVAAEKKDLSSSDKSLLAGIQGANPDEDQVRHVQKGIILANSKKDFEQRVGLTKHLQNFGK